MVLDTSALLAVLLDEPEARCSRERSRRIRAGC